MIQKITIAGAGTMGHSMAQIFASYGYEVTLWNHRAEKLEKAKQQIDPAVREKITYSASDDAFQGRDLIVECIAENLEVKEAFYDQYAPLVDADTILATNTSGLSINTLSKHVKHPEHFLGMHWFNPPALIPLIEIIKCDQTTQETADAVYDISLAIDKKPAVVEKDVYGFAANRLQLAVLREACALVRDGVISVEGIDSVMKYGLGFRWACLGPLETIDFGGIDIFQHIAEYLVPDLEDSHEVPSLIQEHYDKGEYGVKTGKGFYDYSGDKAEAAIQERDRKLQAVYDALYAKKEK